MCRRRKPPYAHMLNFVGGKINEGEDPMVSAYRELSEETAILKRDIHLEHIMNFEYVRDNIIMEVYAGTLLRPALISGEENELLWVDADEDFTDNARYAGDGNIHHIISYVKAYMD